MTGGATGWAGGMVETQGANFEASDMLRVFPTWLPHSVDASASGETRISVSFNIIFPAYTETMSKPLW